MECPIQLCLFLADRHEVVFLMAGRHAPAAAGAAIEIDDHAPTAHDACPW
jgi:hypothetical protein